MLRGNGDVVVREVVENLRLLQMQGTVENSLVYFALIVVEITILDISAFHIMAEKQFVLLLKGNGRIRLNFTYKGLNVLN